ncbi:hypothetical protein KEM60_00832 [Austwickia sp. TVS 96-490-7B]|uniref:DUF4112 domain-containing protein n=1 Tax=Austwickia sp. TVS 96-490-7B TaxID=2830843 RepID=UPI001C59C1C7|nr:DUF4112 domain-containing protein [Austwickia sp. TVS 96-490-7B]MBW3084643.1 hypothetical protein [Austwickia sp. TVS 96-490-7B]
MSTSLAPSSDAALARRRRLAWLLDEMVRVPGTRFRFGLDAVIGLIPGVGDSVSTVLAAAILIDAVRHRIPLRLLLLMGWNLMFDAILGLLPVVGDVADAAHRANVKNVRLLERALVEGRTVPVSYRGYLLRAVLLVAAILTVMVMAAAFTVWWLLSVLLSW